MMHSLLFYELQLREVIGNHVGLALAAGYVLFFFFLSAYGKKNRTPWPVLYWVAAITCLVIPAAFMFTKVIHTDGEQMQLTLQFLPSLIVGGAALTLWREDLQKVLGRWTLPLIAAVVILMAGIPWNYHVEGIFGSSSMTAAKVDPEMAELAGQMEGGSVVLPESVGMQILKVQPELQMQYEDGADWFEDGADIEEVFQYAWHHPTKYAILEKQDYNDSYMEVLVGYKRAYSTEHYDLYVNPAFDQ